MRLARRARRARFLLGLSLVAAPAGAGEYHTGATNNCSDCHTMHNSENGQPMRYDNDKNGAPKLLRAANSLQLCLQCHDGQATAPDVVDEDANQTPDRAAGFFPRNWWQPPPAGSNPTAHLMGTQVDAPWGGQTTLTCVSCHDPHGTASYRNLKLDPRGIGAPRLVVSHQIVPLSGNIAQFYDSSNVRYKSGMTSWCVNCHVGTDQTNHHPVDTTIYNSPNGWASYSAWVGVTLPRVPVQSPNDDIIPSQDDQVFCLSCHKAHGSANPFGLIYPDGATQDSACSQCHVQ
ncbi:MAG TPA: cytochrome c3 family protein [Vicinamibacteria bacterium]|nr:cytochrome c3 family protein [Vicinamibacteria bacterium]